MVNESVCRDDPYRPHERDSGKPLPPSLYLGFAVAAIGGPLALAVIYIPGAADMRSAGLVTPLGAALYAAPLLIWVRFSRDVVSPAGLAGFVEAAAGRRLALVQAAVWAFSYFLYLPYTVTDIVYEMLVVVFPGIEPWRPVLQLVLPIAIVALVLVGTVPALRVLALSAVVQLGILVVLGTVVIHHVGAPSGSFTHAHGLRPGAANIALLFLRQPAALPRERGRRREPTIRRALPIAGVDRSGVRRLRRVRVRRRRPGGARRRPPGLRDRDRVFGPNARDRRRRRRGRERRGAHRR